MKSLTKKLVDFDIYGHPIGVHFKGSDMFKTKLGALLTLMTYILIIFNLTTLIISFFDNSR